MAARNGEKSEKEEEEERRNLIHLEVINMVI